MFIRFISAVLASLMAASSFAEEPLPPVSGHYSGTRWGLGVELWVKQTGEKLAGSYLVYWRRSNDRALCSGEYPAEIAYRDGALHITVPRAAPCEPATMELRVEDGGRKLIGLDRPAELTRKD